MNNTARLPEGATTPGKPPAGHVLYRHWGKDGSLLYAGMTNNPPARLTSHRAQSKWWALVSWTSYEKFPTRDALKAGETWAIKHENPEWNIQERVHNAPSRHSTEPNALFGPYRPITTSELKPEIRLVHPLSHEFRVYGSDVVQRRAREWALDNRVYLLDSGVDCAHAFYLMRCPADGNCVPGADHTQVWVPAPDFSRFEKRSGPDAPFILTQPYATGPDIHASANVSYGGEEFWGAALAFENTEIPESLTAYATAHGLDAHSNPFDAWYNPGHCVPIRLTPGQLWQNRVQSPLEAEALSLMCACRDEWPESVPEWLS